MRRAAALSLALITALSACSAPEPRMQLAPGQKQALCQSMYEMAVFTMMARQEGVPDSVLIAQARDEDLPPAAQDLALAMIVTAYDVPPVSTYQMASMSEAFGREWFTFCQQSFV